MRPESWMTLFWLLASLGIAVLAWGVARGPGLAIALVAFAVGVNLVRAVAAEESACYAENFDAREKAERERRLAEHQLTPAEKKET